MYVVVFASLLALLLTFLEIRYNYRNGMRWGFLIMTAIGAVHFDYGNDYMPYYNLFYEVTALPFDFERILAGDYFHDSGWVFLCFLFKHLGGFFALVAVLFIIQNIIVCRFIEMEVPLNWRLMAVFTYLFCTSNYLMSLSMMRQWFVMFVFIGMWPFIKERKWWIPLIALFLCRFIHGSAIILLPFSFWGFLPIKKGYLTAIIFVVFLFLLWYSGSFANELFQQTVMLTDTDSFVERYEEAEVGKISLRIGAILKYVPLLLGIIYLITSENHPLHQRQLATLSLIGFSITPLTQLMPMIGRLGMYFSVFQIATIPIIYGHIKQSILKRMFLALFIVILLYDYYMFFTHGVFARFYNRPFTSIFSVL